MRRRLSTVTDVAVTVTVSVALVAGVSTSAEPSEIAQAWSIVQIAKACPRRRRRPRDNAWLARLDLGTDLLYDAQGRTRELSSRSTCHTDKRYLG
jgi:hypothetical protein